MQENRGFNPSLIIGVMATLFILHLVTGLLQHRPVSQQMKREFKLNPQGQLYALQRYQNGELRTNGTFTGASRLTWYLEREYGERAGFSFRVIGLFDDKNCKMDVYDKEGGVWRIECKDGVWTKPHKVEESEQ